MDKQVNEINVPEIDGRLQALTQQRDFANNQVVHLAGSLNAAQARIRELEAEVKSLKEQHPVNEAPDKEA